MNIEIEREKNNYFYKSFFITSIITYITFSYIPPDKISENINIYYNDILNSIIFPF